MLGVTQIADLYAFLYADIPTPPGTFDHMIPVDGAYAAIKRIDGVDYVCFRGSVTFLDWIEDFTAASSSFAPPTDDPVLGWVHPGAAKAVQAIKNRIDNLVGDHVVFVGHSLGAMHAAIAAGYRVAAGKPVDALVMFGEPRPGGPGLSGILVKTDVRSYCNRDAYGFDLVTAVPRALAPLLPYQHVRDPLTDVSMSPSPADPWLAFRYHHFSLYCRAFGCAGPAALALYQ